jgi:hypothetical protein
MVNVMIRGHFSSRRKCGTKRHIPKEAKNGKQRGQKWQQSGKLWQNCCKKCKKSAILRKKK